MILDLRHFVEKEQPYWQELEKLLTRFSSGVKEDISIDDVQRFCYLHERVSEDLVKLSSFAGDAEVRKYLSSLVARSYAEIHAGDRDRLRLRPLQWLRETFPRAFRRNLMAFWLALAVTSFGAGFGGILVAIDPEAKEVLFPQGGGFQHLQMDPEKRVAGEEQAESSKMAGNHHKFAAFLMQNNISVSIKMLALGMTFGIGTVLALLYNGVLLGAVFGDYIQAGQLEFVLAWLLPHGVTEIPAVLIAAQGGLVVGGCLLKPQGARIASFRKKLGDIVALIFGAALLLVWSGVVESFLSQYHHPVIPYSWKIIFGVIELILLIAYLGLSGREKPQADSGQKDSSVKT